MGVLCVVVAMPARAQTADIAAIMERMQEIISEMQALQSEFADLSGSIGVDTAGSSDSSSPVAPTGSVLGAATSVLQQEAVYGATNDSIEKIQTLLATDPLIYPDGITSGFFGPKTQAAIRNLQARFGMDPVGVVGPSTATLLMEYFVAYPGGGYPRDVLQSRPSASAPTTPTPSATSADTDTASEPTADLGPNPIDRVYLNREDDETIVRVTLTDGGAFGLISDSRNEDDLIAAIAERGDIDEAFVAAVIDMSDIGGSRGRSNDDENDDEDAAEDAIEDAEDALDDADDAIDEAEEDDEETEYAEDLLKAAEDLLEAAEEAFDEEDYEEAIELAEEAEDKAEDAEDAIGEDRSDAIDEIVATVGGDSARIEVEYDDGEDDSFTVNETDEDDIIEAVADRLDLRESEVEDEIDFETADIDEIEVAVDDSVSFVTVEFSDGSELTFTVFKTDEDELIEHIADELDVDEDDVADLIDFD